MVRVAAEHHRAPSEVARTYSLDDLADLAEDGRRQNEQMKSKTAAGGKPQRVPRSPAAVGKAPPRPQNRRMGQRPRGESA